MSTLEQAIAEFKDLGVKIEVLDAEAKAHRDQADECDAQADGHRWEQARIVSESTFPQGGNKAAHRERGLVPASEWAERVGLSKEYTLRISQVWRRYGSSRELHWQDGRVLSFNDHFEALNHDPERLAEMMAKAEAAGVGLDSLRQRGKRERREAEAELTPEKIVEALQATDDLGVLQAVTDAVDEAHSRLYWERDTATEDEINAIGSQMAQDIANRAEEDLTPLPKPVSFQYEEVTGGILKARRSMAEALKASEGVDFNDEDREVIVGLMGKLKATIGLLEMRMAGTVDVDWDAELRNLA